MKSEISFTSKTQSEFSTLKAILIFAFAFVAMMCVSMFVGSLLVIPCDPGSRASIMLMNTSQNVFGFCGAAFVTAYFLGRGRVLHWLTLNILPTWGAVFFTLLSFPFLSPVIEWLEAWNNSLHLPESMASLEFAMRNMEAQAAAVTERLLSDTSIWGLVSGILVIGFLTGFGEELLFRGTLQKILTRGMGTHCAVWVTAVIFSAIHLQFLGFFPRMLMGLWFGYLLIITRSIWVPVLAHALNNSIVVIDSWLEAKGRIPDETFWSKLTDTSSSPWIVVISILLLTVLILLWIKGPLRRLMPLNSDC